MFLPNRTYSQSECTKNRHDVFEYRPSFSQRRARKKSKNRLILGYRAKFAKSIKAEAKSVFSQTCPSAYDPESRQNEYIRSLDRLESSQLRERTEWYPAYQPGKTAPILVLSNSPSASRHMVLEWRLPQQHSHQPEEHFSPMIPCGSSNSPTIPVNKSNTQIAAAKPSRCLISINHFLG